jgi:hypothetical protein
MLLGQEERTPPAGQPVANDPTDERHSADPFVKLLPPMREPVRSPVAVRRGST